MYGSKAYATIPYASVGAGAGLPPARKSPYCKMDEVYFEKASPFTKKLNPYVAMESDCD